MSSSKTLIVSMFTTINNSLENVRLRKKSPHILKVLVQKGGLKLLQHLKFQDIYFCCFSQFLGSKAAFFA